MKGSWFAQWGNWGIRISWQNGAWEAKVWQWRRGRALERQYVLATQTGFATSNTAVEWAWSEMQKDGAKIFVLSAPEGFSPIGMLPFRPMLEAVA
jgi:hypothetical protein